MTFFEVDPSIVRPGWIPLILLILMGAALVFLYRSMRRQFRRIDVSRFQDGSSGEPGEPQPPGSESEDGRGGSALTDASASSPADEPSTGTATGRDPGDGAAGDHTGQASRR